MTEYLKKSPSPVKVKEKPKRKYKKRAKPNKVEKSKEETEVVQPKTPPSAFTLYSTYRFKQMNDSCI